MQAERKEGDNSIMHRRGKREILTDYNLSDCYRLYRKNKKHKGVTSAKYKEIMYDFFSKLMNRIIDHSETFVFPHNMGNFAVRKRKLTNLFNEDGSLRSSLIPVDWKATRELWKQRPDLHKKGLRILHMNEHTNGYIYNFKWTKINSHVPNIKDFAFNPVRRYNVQLKNTITNNPEIDYYEKKRLNTRRPKKDKDVNR